MDRLDFVEAALLVGRVVGKRPSEIGLRERLDVGVGRRPFHNFHHAAAHFQPAVRVGGVEHGYRSLGAR
ncbi:hypothetical protein RZS08_05975, partial [Arthrospira platensis SPKY1]|nr:hypothetical protein [Arthrospira platensis SPKY1]